MDFRGGQDPSLPPSWPEQGTHASVEMPSAFCTPPRSRRCPGCDASVVDSEPTRTGLRRQRAAAASLNPASSGTLRCVLMAVDRAHVCVKVRAVDPTRQHRRRRSVLESSVAGITPRNGCLKMPPEFSVSSCARECLLAVHLYSVEQTHDSAVAASSVCVQVVVGSSPAGAFQNPPFCFFFQR